MLFIQARWYTPGPRRNPIRKIVVHSAETLERLDTAEAVARYFANHPGVDSRGRPSKPSAHVSADADSRVRSVHDYDIAHAAPGANHDGLHLELAGRAGQSLEEWLDDFSRRTIEGPAADQVAEWVTAHSIPVHFLTAEEMRGNPDAWGITTHFEVSEAYGQSTHWDPGPAFPMGLLLGQARQRLMPALIIPEEDDMPATYCRDTRYQNVFVDPYGGTVSSMPAQVEEFTHDQRLASCVWKAWGCTVADAIERRLLLPV